MAIPTRTAIAITFMSTGFPNNVLISGMNSYSRSEITSPHMSGISWQGAAQLLSIHCLTGLAAVHIIA
eukprot:scaffold401776_cov19-Prasinocladus_malaysianus.AAC.1